MKHRFILISIFFIALILVITDVHTAERQSSINDYFDKLGDKLYEGGFDSYRLKDNFGQNDYVYINPLAFDEKVVTLSVSSAINKKVKGIFLKYELRFTREMTKVIDDNSDPKKTLTVNGEIKREKDNYHVTVFLVDNDSRRISQAEERMPISLFQERKLFMTIFDPADSQYHNDRVVRKAMNKINELLGVAGFKALVKNVSTGQGDPVQGRAEMNSADFIIRFTLSTSKIEPSGSPFRCSLYNRSNQRCTAIHRRVAC